MIVSIGPDRPTEDASGTNRTPAGGAPSAADVAGLAREADLETLVSFARRHPERRDELEAGLLAAGRSSDIHRLAQALSTTGVVDVYIGGGFDDVSPTGPVESYVESLVASPRGGRESLYFNYGEVSEATAAVQEAVDAGKLVNIIGHSYGATSAIRVANGVEGRIETLVGVDPVTNYERGPHREGVYPDHVRSVVMIDDTRSEGPVAARTDGDDIENAGLALDRQEGGEGRVSGYLDGRVSVIPSNAGHENFASMLGQAGPNGQPSVRQRLDAMHADWLRVGGRPDVFDRD